MAAAYFTDRNRAPNEKDVLGVLGRAAATWTELFDEVHAEHPDLRETWRYYADGKSWLLKVSRRSRTMFWVSVERGAFRVAFYFPERLSEALLASDLTERRKTEVRDSAPAGKLRRVSVVFGSRRGIRDVMQLIALKKTVG